MSLLDLFEALKPYQKTLVLLLPIGGIFIGWILKTVSDLFMRAKEDWSTRRECVFYLLQSWKNILDYERYISSLSNRELGIDEYEVLRTVLSQKLKTQLVTSKDSLKSGIVALASVDPTAAAQLDNTLKNFVGLLSYEFTQMAELDPQLYQKFNREFYDQIDWTLSDISNQAKVLAAKSGLFQKRRAKKWFEARMKGSAEFHEGMTKFEGNSEEKEG